MISAIPFTAYPVVCLGGASVNFDAFSHLLRIIPPDLGIAVVVINQVHDLSEEKLLFEDLSRCTKMPVQVITDGMPLQPNHVFVFQGFGDLFLAHRELRLAASSKPAGWTNVITLFLGSLARNWRGQVVAVILSGLDGDGASGLSEIRKARGITIVQTVDSAKDPGMPTNAIESGLADMILSLEDIGKQIELIAKSWDEEEVAQ